MGAVCCPLCSWVNSFNLLANRTWQFIGRLRRHAPFNPFIHAISAVHVPSLLFLFLHLDYLYCASVHFSSRTIVFLSAKGSRHFRSVLPCVIASLTAMIPMVGVRSASVFPTLRQCYLALHTVHIVSICP